MPRLERITKSEFEQVGASGQTEVETTDGLRIIINNPEAYRRAMSPENSEKPVVLFISGTSESGKSTFGKLAVESGIGHRVKIYATLADVRDEMGAVSDEPTSYDYGTRIASDSSLTDETAKRILNKYKQLMNETGVPIVVVETIKHQWMVDRFKQFSDIRFLSIFIDADLEKRIEREAKKTGKPLDLVRAEVLDKDEWKRELGSESIDKVADIHVVNNGSFNTYRTMVVSFLEALKDNSQDYSGIPIDFSR
ncbi:MAG: hypothetical protein PHO31_01500 [Candidatus Pacebacteria bacterium]|nr:hypothetical protein [Candidatus Paceibacterota bacterium]